MLGKNFKCTIQMRNITGTELCTWQILLSSHSCIAFTQKQKMDFLDNPSYVTCNKTSNNCIVAYKGIVRRLHGLSQPAVTITL